MKAVKLEFAQESDDNIFVKEVLESLGNQKALEQMLLRTRSSVIGPMPKHRNNFNPDLFLKRVFRKSPIITMDSNILNDNWHEDI